MQRVMVSTLRGYEADGAWVFRSYNAAGQG